MNVTINPNAVIEILQRQIEFDRNEKLLLMQQIYDLTAKLSQYEKPVPATKEK